MSHINELNALFELVGACLAWQNADAARHTRPAGCSPALIAFSALWAVECIPYYLAHQDLNSALLASLRCVGHVLWSARALRWSRVSQPFDVDAYHKQSCTVDRCWCRS